MHAGLVYQHPSFTFCFHNIAVTWDSDLFPAIYAHAFLSQWWWYLASVIIRASFCPSFLQALFAYPLLQLSYEYLDGRALRIGRTEDLFWGCFWGVTIGEVGLLVCVSASCTSPFLIFLYFLSSCYVIIFSRIILLIYQLTCVLLFTRNSQLLLSVYKASLQEGCLFQSIVEYCKWWLDIVCPMR